MARKKRNLVAVLAFVLVAVVVAAVAVGQYVRNLARQAGEEAGGGAVGGVFDRLFPKGGDNADAGGAGYLPEWVTASKTYRAVAGYGGQAAEAADSWFAGWFAGGA